MHPFTMQAIAQERLHTGRGGALRDVPEHLRENVWAAWALTPSGRVTSWSAVRNRLAGLALGRPKDLPRRGRPASVVAVAAPHAGAARPVALLGCRP